MTNRREFLAGATGVVALGQTVRTSPPKRPWYQRTYRWGQTNITEADPPRYDIAWWREFWKRTRVQGVIINAGGIVAYYPSKLPLQHRAEFLGDRDIYGDVAKAAHDDGLVVVARMDSNRASEDFFKAHPDWFTRDSAGNPYRAADKYITCINSNYYDQYLPTVLTEIIDRSRPEGFADNSWSGLTRESICFCENCAAKFRDKSGLPLPRQHDWDDPAYRQWIDWNYARRLEVWDLNNRATKSAGGPDCLWFGMNSGSVSSQSHSFRDFKAILERAPMVFLDHQDRGAAGFQENADSGKLVHGVLGWDKLAAESMAMYQVGIRSSFRVASKPAPEARMWMIEGFAGGIQPWWHHIGAYHEDRRMYETAEPVMKWWADNEQYLINRKPLANVGVVWSQRNTDFYGRDKAADLTDAPYRGFVQALMRARIPYVPVHIDHIERDSNLLRVLVLPNIAAMTDAQAASIRTFVSGGGAVIATGLTSLYDQFGDPRNDFALAGVFGAHWTGKAGDERKQPESQHTYLRLTPELRSTVWGPRTAGEPHPVGTRHPILHGFEKTDILPFGGMLGGVKADPGALVPLTFVPRFPIYPPETAWMRQPYTDIPALIVKGRVAFMPADIDRRYARESLPDYAQLLANLVRWAVQDELPVELKGAGVFDCNAFTQPSRVIVHVVNLTAAAWVPMDELVPVGPVTLRVKLPAGVAGRNCRLLVSNRPSTVRAERGWAEVTLSSVLDHEVVVFE